MPGLRYLATTGLDPLVHAELRLTTDWRVKPGNEALAAA
jgi:hypothetical protein